MPRYDSGLRTDEVVRLEPLEAPFHALENWDAEAVMKLLRERLLARLVQRHAISEDLGR